jgi:hypothetical protein
MFVMDPRHTHNKKYQQQQHQKHNGCLHPENEMFDMEFVSRFLFNLGSG